MKVTSIEIKDKGFTKKGKEWTLYQVKVDDGRTASGFDFVKVNDEVDLQQKGDFLNYTKSGGSTKPKFMGSESLFTKDDYWTRKEKRDLDQQPRIERQHSQQMALMYYQITGKMPESWGEFKDKISQFQRDIGTSPVPVPVQQDIQGLQEIPQPQGQPPEPEYEREMSNKEDEISY